MKKWLFIIIIFFFTFSVSGADEGVQSIDTPILYLVEPNNHIYYNSNFIELHNYSPSYTLVPIPNEFIVNPGDTVKISLYVSGFGDIRENKIRLFIPPKLLDSKNPGIMGSTIVCQSDNDNHTFAGFQNKNSTISNSVISFAKCNFMSVNVEDNWINTLSAPILISERANEGWPPIYFQMNIAEKRPPPGDHYVNLVFTYTDGNKWYQDTQKIKIHVNSFYEQYYIFYIVLIGVIISIIGQFVIGLYNIIKNKRKQDINYDHYPNQNND